MNLLGEGSGTNRLPMRRNEWILLSLVLHQRWSTGAGKWMGATFFFLSQGPHVLPVVNCGTCVVSCWPAPTMWHSSSGDQPQRCAPSCFYSSARVQRTIRSRHFHSWCPHKRNHPRPSGAEPKHPLSCISSLGEFCPLLTHFSWLWVSMFGE